MTKAASPSLTGLHDGAPPAAAVSDRSSEILVSIRAAFARKGFDGTSMNDLAREAGMSVGNFYRYFPSKTAIVEALVSQDIAGIEADFAQIMAAPDKMTALRAGIRSHLETLEHDDCRLWAEISAAALRQSDVAATCALMEETVTQRILTIFATVTGLSEPECLDRFGAHASYIVLVIRSCALRADNRPDSALNALILRGIDRVLDEIPCLPPAPPAKG